MERMEKTMRMEGGWKSVARYLFPYHKEAVTDIIPPIPVFRISFWNMMSYLRLFKFKRAFWGTEPQRKQQLPA